MCHVWDFLPGSHVTVTAGPSWVGGSEESALTSLLKRFLPAVPEPSLSAKLRTNRWVSRVTSDPQIRRAPVQP